MANPRVFISSTCYDLSEVRDSLVEFIRSFGFEPVLSDRGDVFYHPDIHTHDSCLNEVGNCELLVLIIGGRFGGSYTADPSKSIVNAEYFAAREKKIPVFTFVKRNVYSDHFVFSKNRSNPSLNEIIFPSIENNKNAERIFTFIDDVRHAPVNNGFFPFDFAREITEVLRKQWAGMFFDFLQQRSANDQLKSATNLLNSISIAGEKVEELVKRLYRHIDTTGADATIEDVETRASTRKFFEECLDFIPDPEFRKLDRSVDVHDFELWYEYLAHATGGKIVRNIEPGSRIAVQWGAIGIVVEGTESRSTERLNRQQQQQFEVVKSMAPETVRSIISEFPTRHD